MHQKIFDTGPINYRKFHASKNTRYGSEIISIYRSDVRWVRFVSRLYKRVFLPPLFMYKEEGGPYQFNLGVAVCGRFYPMACVCL